MAASLQQLRLLHQLGRFVWGMLHNLVWRAGAGLAWLGSVEVGLRGLLLGGCNAWNLSLHLLLGIGLGAFIAANAS